MWANAQRDGEEKKEEEDRKKLQGKNIMAPLLYRAAINRILLRETFQARQMPRASVTVRQIVPVKWN